MVSPECINFYFFRIKLQHQEGLLQSPSKMLSAILIKQSLSSPLPLNVFKELKAIVCPMVCGDRFLEQFSLNFDASLAV